MLTFNAPGVPAVLGVPGVLVVTGVPGIHGVPGVPGVGMCQFFQQNYWKNRKAKAKNKMLA